jgi:hypothetical protein
VVSSLGTSVRNYHEFAIDREAMRIMNRMEVLCINRVKKKLRAYDEEDENISLGECEASIRYDDTTVSITIEYGQFTRSRVLEFDDVEDIVSSYH